MQNFSLDNHENMLRAFQNSGYRSTSFEKSIPEDQQLLLRHDVDFCPQYCLPIAHLEANLKYQATYYFLMSSPFYNCYDVETKTVIHKILSLGHWIGLHFDVTAYSGNPEKIEKFALRELHNLQQISGIKIKSISFHRPSKGLIGYEKNFAGCVHTYQPRFIEDFVYYSDSQGRWRFGHPLVSDAYKQKKPMQILTHPIWWHNKTAESPVERLKTFLHNNLQRHVSYTAQNCIPFQEYLESNSTEISMIIESPQ